MATPHYALKQRRGAGGGVWGGKVGGGLLVGIYEVKKRREQSEEERGGIRGRLFSFEAPLTWTPSLKDGRSIAR